MTEIEQIRHRLNIYQQRLSSLEFIRVEMPGYYNMDYVQSEIKWYSEQINEMQAELSVHDLMCELALVTPKRHFLKTTKLSVVKKIIQEENVVVLKQRFSIYPFRLDVSY